MSEIDFTRAMWGHAFHIHQWDPATRTGRATCHSMERVKEGDVAVVKSERGEMRLLLTNVKWLRDPDDMYSMDFIQADAVTERAKVEDVHVGGLHYRRQTWHVDHLDIVDEPMILSLAKYRQYEDRQPTDREANVVSSHVGSRHAPIIDLDFPHAYVPSTTPGHGHLYLNVPISRWRLWVLLWGLRVGGVIEKGNFWWSLRRGGTFVRRLGVQKTESEAAVEYSYGMFFKTKEKK